MSATDDDAFEAREEALGERLADAEWLALRNEVTCGMRVDSSNEAHTMVSVFVGRNEGARGHSGNLVFRTDEWREICKRFIGAHGRSGKLVIEFDAMEPLLVKYQDGTPVAFDGIDIRRAPRR